MQSEDDKQELEARVDEKQRVPATRPQQWYPEGLAERVTDEIMQQWGGGGDEPVVVLLTPFIDGDGTADELVHVVIVNPVGSSAEATVFPDEMYDRILGEEIADRHKRLLP